MTWRAEWDRRFLGRADTREAAQAFASKAQTHAIVTDETTGERWMQHVDGTWAETVRAARASRQAAPDPDTCPRLPPRADIDG